MAAGFHSNQARTHLYWISLRPLDYSKKHIVLLTLIKNNNDKWVIWSHQSSNVSQHDCLYTFVPQLDVFWLCFPMMLCTGCSESSGSAGKERQEGRAGGRCGDGLSVGMNSLLEPTLPIMHLYHLHTVLCRNMYIVWWHHCDITAVVLIPVRFWWRQWISWALELLAVM